MKNIAPAPAVQAPTPFVESFSPAQAVSWSQAPGVESLAPAPVLSASPAPGGYFSPAPALFRVGGLEGSVQDRVPPLVVDMIFGWRRAVDASGRVYYWHVPHAPDAMDASCDG